ncbi:hypothetical protein BV20DRAFT_1033013 [Pilatotrama ljubarskyi]|nr:hypothetical protein BV20DRAFT_1033013 [Pilatotrama ljubarskyi]
MQQPGFNPADVASFDAAREVQRLDTYIEETEGSPLSARDGWINGSVVIRLPKEGERYPSEADAPAFTVQGVYYRSLTEVIQNAYQQPCVKDWHIIPYRLYWMPSCANTIADDSGSSGSPSRSRSHSSSSPNLPWDRSQSSSSSSSSTSRSSSSAYKESGIRVYSEIYDSDALLADDEEIQRRPREADDADDIEYAIAPLLLWSDSTHLANFGTASLWPAYAYFGSQSKYTRGKPTAFAAHHVAYIPSLPDVIQDTYTQIYGVPATAAMLTFLKRELMQEVWLLLLDNRFMYIYVHGLLLLCGDEIRRRLFPRFQFHSADYVEKILQACLKYFAKCPCPRCRINKDKLLEMGTRNDTYRRNHLRLDDNDLQYRIKLTRCWIFEQGVSLTSVHMKRVLDPLSITPTRNAFSVRLREHGFNFYSLYVPDLMHEFELGVWKSVLTHILRILYAAGGDTIQELNRRFRQVPTFGRIRKFCDNVADQRKLAARDYENNLRTSMPVMEALLDSAEDDKIVLDMLFDLNSWHCLAKLRAHTEPLLEALSIKAIEVGRDVRKFAKVTCTKWHTVDLPKEAAARGRRKAAVSKKTGKVFVGKEPVNRKRRTFNLNTYKYHSIRDYPTIIRLHATTDNWSTQTGELEHRHVKRFYARTNKNNHEYQIAQHMRRAEKLRIIKTRVDAARQKVIEAENGRDPAEARGPANTAAPPSPELVNADKEEDIAYSNPWDRYHIAESQRDSDDIAAWVSAHRGDPAYKDFIPRLRSHLCSRWDSINSDDSDLQVGEAPAVPQHLHIVNNRIYHHRVFRINYTTYDVRRAQDSVNPRTHPDIFMLSGTTTAHSLEDDISCADLSDNHPFTYARVIGVFHVNVRPLELPYDDLVRMDVLWVRWLAVDQPGGFSRKRLPRLQFVKDGPDEAAFGFVDPRDVIRGIHLIPAFAHKHTVELLGPSEAARVGPDYSQDNDTDFRYYYANLFADRDIFLRYHGGGIGHSLYGGEHQPEFFLDQLGSDPESPDDEEDEDVLDDDPACAEGAPADYLPADVDGPGLPPVPVGAAGQDDLLALAAGLAGDEDDQDELEYLEEPEGDDDGREDDQSGGELDEELGEYDEYGDEGFAPL